VKDGAAVCVGVLETAGGVSVGPTGIVGVVCDVSVLKTTVSSTCTSATSGDKVA